MENKETKFEIITRVEETQVLGKEQAREIAGLFEPLFQKAQEWKSKAAGLVVTDVSDTKTMSKAREARLELKEIRVNADKIRKQLKEESLLKGRAIEGMFNVIKFLVKPIEDRLLEQEQFAERRAELELDELEAKRESEMGKYVEDTSVYNLRTMKEEAYQEMVANQKELYDIRLKEREVAEARRIEEEKRVAKEQEAIRLENEKLKKEAEAREAREKKEREAREKEAEAENKRRQEAEAKRKAEEEKRLEVERAKREKIERELSLERAKAEERAKEEAEAKKRAELAPDKDKLRTLAITLFAVGYPEVKSEEAKGVVKGVQELMKKVNMYIMDSIDRI